MQICSQFNCFTPVGKVSLLLLSRLFFCLYFSIIWSRCSLACTSLDLSSLAFTQVVSFDRFTHFCQTSENDTHYSFSTFFLQPQYLFFYDSRETNIIFFIVFLQVPKVFFVVSSLFSFCYFDWAVSKIPHHIHWFFLLSSQFCPLTYVGITPFSHTYPPTSSQG